MAKCKLVARNVRFCVMRDQHCRAKYLALRKETTTLTYHLTENPTLTSIRSLFYGREASTNQRLRTHLGSEQKLSGVLVDSACQFLQAASACSFQQQFSSERSGLSCVTSQACIGPLVPLAKTFTVKSVSGHRPGLRVQVPWRLVRIKAPCAPYY